MRQSEEIESLSERVRAPLPLEAYKEIADLMRGLESNLGWAVRSRAAVVAVLNYATTLMIEVEDRERSN